MKFIIEGISASDLTFAVSEGNVELKDLFISDQSGHLYIKVTITLTNDELVNFPKA